MVNMKDVPSTERMVLCSKQWKVMTQKEKDMFQKRCEQVSLVQLRSRGKCNESPVFSLYVVDRPSTASLIGS